MPSGAGAVSAGLDCETAVSYVLAHHPAVEAGRAGVLEARAATDLNRWLGDPELRVRTETLTRNRDTRVGLRLPVPGPGVPGAERRAAEAQLGASAAEADAVAAQIAAAVRADYALVRYAEARHAILAGLAEKAQERAALIGHMVEAGTATSLEQASASLEAREARDRAERAREARMMAEQAVRRWTGQPAGTTDCAGLGAIDPEHAVESHPAVREARAEAEEAGANAFIARRERWPWPSFVEITWVREHGDGENGVLFQAGIDLPVPSTSIEEALAREHRRRLESAAAEWTVRGDIQSAARDHAVARQVLERIEAESDEIRRIRALLAEGELEGASPDQLWSLHRRVAEWEERLNEARYETDLRAIELRLKSGRP